MWKGFGFFIVYSKFPPSLWLDAKFDANTQKIYIYKIFQCISHIFGATSPTVSWNKSYILLYDAIILTHFKGKKEKKIE